MRVSYITLFSSDDGTDQAKAPHLVGTFHDRFECQEGVWLFSERKGSIELKIR